MRSTYSKITLKPAREASALRGHLWIFSGAVAKIEGRPEEGDVVEVFSSSGAFIGMGHYQKSSIAVRLFSFVRTEPDADFWTSKIRQAVDFRTRLGLPQPGVTTMYRLVHGEGDFLPGLAADLYDGALVLEYHSAGMGRMGPLVTEAFSRVLGGSLKRIVERGTSAHTDSTENLIEALEYGRRFLVDITTGQKTGFFLDQRENRRLLADYAKSKTILNAFSYTGGFSVYAALAGAARIVSVDSSVKALELLKRNVELNLEGGAACEHEIVKNNVFEFLKTASPEYDIIVLDPPAFAKHLSAKQTAIQAYTRLTAEALVKLKRPGLLFTFSCSQAVTPDLFEGAVRAAVIASGLRARILHRLRQGPDHPVSLTHPEGEYLKGLALEVM